ncbi:amidohydrolase [Nocardioides immobilis]|uniref:Amidohydrolase n=1 Tax=Nocardioides immobilis TaxID=2049295 RepID=A0A417Y7P7_9ACTN|nr:amidohydrolase family protein [Nocardioides immobilis]RHW28605.1 amidohydrolase [Nocardioides immobilis]
MTVHLRDVEVDGEITDVCESEGRITALGRGECAHRTGGPPPVTVDGAGAALLPGLHDHHVHVLALAAAWDSINCGERLDALRTAPGTGWVRGVNAAVSVDRHALDAVVPDRPVRVQHRSGGLWMLNSAALAAVAHVLDDSADVERDPAGEPTGRLWRYDERLRPALPDASPDLQAVGRRLAARGITGVTDATPDLDPTAVALLRQLPQRLLLLGDPLGEGPRKLLLRDHDLPTFDELTATIAAAHALPRPLAIHCVTRESLLLTLAALEDVGVVPGDRIEHAAICPPEAADWLTRLGVAVVTQPDFLRTRGSAYLRDVSPHDLPHLYPHARLLAAGVRTTASSDAPFGEVDPWRVIATAAERPIGAEESVRPRAALDGYLSAPLDPGGPARRVAPGAPADLVLLDAPLEVALRSPVAVTVRATWIAGERIHGGQSAG